MSGLLGMTLGVISLLLKIKTMALVALFFSVYSFLNARQSTGSTGSSGISFSLMSVVMNYANLYFVPMKPSS
jgi:hypothetical protein